MNRRFAIVFTLLIGLLLASCSAAELAPPPTATQPPRPTLTAGQPAAPIPDPATVSGQFELTNTSPDMPEVLVEAMEMVFEYRTGPGGAWQRLASECEFTPAVPVLVRDKQAVGYDCQLEQALAPAAELRAAVEIRLMGSDQIFRMQIEH